jgi:hypothetical protein
MAFISASESAVHRFAVAETANAARRDETTSDPFSHSLGRGCVKTHCFQFRGSSHPSEGGNRRIQRELRARFRGVVAQSEFSHTLDP